MLRYARCACVLRQEDLRAHIEAEREQLEFRQAKDARDAHEAAVLREQVSNPRGREKAVNIAL